MSPLLSLRDKNTHTHWILWNFILIMSVSSMFNKFHVGILAFGGWCSFAPPDANFKTWFHKLNKHMFNTPLNKNQLLDVLKLSKISPFLLLEPHISTETQVFLCIWNPGSCFTEASLRVIILRLCRSNWRMVIGVTSERFGVAECGSLIMPGKSSSCN